LTHIKTKLPDWQIQFRNWVLQSGFSSSMSTSKTTPAPGCNNQIVGMQRPESKQRGCWWPKQRRDVQNAMGESVQNEKRYFVENG
jgi:hypothetical protein